MSSLAIFGILSGVFSFISYPPYIIAILKGQTKPERASWLIWSVLTTMGFFTQFAVGATHFKSHQKLIAIDGGGGAGKTTL